ncbi:hypothetical protein Bbelb_293260 [Branchiostoma belcheri]|nr:hypothetical protein Bbelb_293260 [Branchiostoma belcheri]
MEAFLHRLEKGVRSASRPAGFRQFSGLHVADHSYNKPASAFYRRHRELIRTVSNFRFGLDPVTLTRRHSFRFRARQPDGRSPWQRDRIPTCVIPAPTQRASAIPLKRHTRVILVQLCRLRVIVFGSTAALVSASLVRCQLRVIRLQRHPRVSLVRCARFVSNAILVSAWSAVPASCNSAPTLSSCQPGPLCQLRVTRLQRHPRVSLVRCASFVYHGSNATLASDWSAWSAVPASCNSAPTPSSRPTGLVCQLRVIRLLRHPRVSLVRCASFVSLGSNATLASDWSGVPASCPSAPTPPSCQPGQPGPVCQLSVIRLLRHPRVISAQPPTSRHLGSTAELVTFGSNTTLVSSRLICILVSSRPTRQTRVTSAQLPNSCLLGSTAKLVSSRLTCQTRVISAQLPSSCHLGSTAKLALSRLNCPPRVFSAQLPTSRHLGSTANHVTSRLNYQPRVISAQLPNSCHLGSTAQLVSSRLNCQTRVISAQPPTSCHLGSNAQLVSSRLNCQSRVISAQLPTSCHLGSTANLVTSRLQRPTRVFSAQLPISCHLGSTAQLVSSRLNCPTRVISAQPPTS